MRNPALSPVWPGPRLLVPVPLDVYLVGTPDRQPPPGGPVWANTGVNYANVSGQNPGVVPFAPKNPPGVGAHLLWSLPNAIRRGDGSQLNDTGEVIYPFAPNRWVVLQSVVAEGKSGRPPALRAWVLESDNLSGNNPESSSYPDFVGSGNSFQVLKIGQVFRIEDWKGEQTEKPFLKALGPGDAAWAAAYDNVRNVFAFYSDLSDPLQAPVGSYSFTVAGWYSDPTHDPLYAGASGWRDQASWVALMAKLGWGVGDDAAAANPARKIAAAQADWAAWQATHGLKQSSFDASQVDDKLLQGLGTLIKQWGAYYQANGLAALPQMAEFTLPGQVLCHGASVGVPWLGARHSYYQTRVAPGNLTVTAGNTPAQAVATWLAHMASSAPGDVPTLQTAVEAFQKGILFDLNEKPTETEAALQRASFGSAGAAVEYIVVFAEQEPKQDAEGDDYLLTGGGGEQTVPLNSAQTVLLDQLNEAQRALEAASEELDAVKWEVWSLFRKKLYLVRNDVSTEQVDKAIVDLVGESAVEGGDTLGGVVGAVTQRKDSAAGAVAKNLQALKAALEPAAETDKKFVVKTGSRPPFAEPVDPVILIAGANFDGKLSAPEAYGSEQFLLTRFTGQTLSAIEINEDGNPVTLTSEKMLAAVRLPGANTSLKPLGIPKEIGDLWFELMLADGANAPWINAVYSVAYRARFGSEPPDATESIRRQQQTLWFEGPVAAVTKVAQFPQGVRPSNIAFVDGSNQPFSPLFMDWKVEWRPSPLDSNGFPQNWQLGDLDYEWNGTLIPKPDHPMIFSGRTGINPLAPRTLTSQIESFAITDEFKHLPTEIQTELIQVKEAIGNADFIAQSLHGLTDSLATRQLTQSAPIQSRFQGTVVLPESGPLRDLVNASQSSVPIYVGDGSTPPPFSPIRAGHLRILQLWVVDAFGMVVQAPPEGATGDQYIFLKPPPSTALVTPKFENEFIQFAPRFTQPARLNFTQIDATDDSLETTSAHARSPICGWLMPNHLDDSLSIFDSAGNSLGEVISILKDEGQTGLRWDIAPGIDRPLGSPPAIANARLRGFVDALLARGVLGNDALRDLLDAIDTALWSTDPLGNQGGENAAVLVGRPLALVRARLTIDLMGAPFLQFNQALAQTGVHYPPAKPPDFTKAPFSVRIGDGGFQTNGVLGYFVNDDYNTFYSVYGTDLETAVLRRTLAAGGDFETALMTASRGGAAAARRASDYVQSNHDGVRVAPLAADRKDEVYLSILMDPRGEIPVVSGAFPIIYSPLPPGPVTIALENLAITFRVGPVLVDPGQIRMPVPSELRGDWSWIARESVTVWGGGQPVKDSVEAPQLGSARLRLGEGWFRLRGGLPDSANHS